MSERKKARRTRSINFHVCLNEEELALIKERMAHVGISNMGAYIRKMSIDGYFVNIDLTSINELVSLLRICSNNLNQITKLANQTHNIYAADIEDLRRQHDALFDTANNIMQKLAKIK